MTKTWKPALLLMVASPLLAEVVSGATPVTQFVLPWVFLPYVTVLYGLPVLVLREVAVRRGYGPLGLWCLGVLYALYNEGLLAETLFHPLDVPMPAFETYGLVAGIRLPFVLWIACWHGLFSLLTPVVIGHHLFPGSAAKPWLPWWATRSLGSLLVGAAVAHFLFLGDAAHRLGPGPLVRAAGLLVAAGLGLWFAAARMPRSLGSGLGRRPFLAGASLYVLFWLVPEILAQNRLPWPLFIGYLVAFAGVAGWALTRGDAAEHRQVVLLVLGANAVEAALAVPFGLLSGNVLWAVTGATGAAIFAAGARKIARPVAAVRP